MPTRLPDLNATCYGGSGKEAIPLDVAIIGGGPAGITAGLELSKRAGLNIALFEKHEELGGIPKPCNHFFFGLRDRKRLFTGPAYARKLGSLIRKTSVQIHLGAMVLKVGPGSPGEAHCLDVLSQEGLKSYTARSILLATGCFESSRHARLIPGARPAGIYTTGTLQQLVNQGVLRLTGRRAVSIGSEHVALSCVLTLKKARASIAAMVEQNSELHTYSFLAEAMARVYRFPTYRDTSVDEIVGNEQVEGMALLRGKEQKPFHVDCDIAVITGRFRPESSLIENTSIERDPSTCGPLVNMDLMTSALNIFAAGNVYRGADMHDLCALEGKLAARSILRALDSNDTGTGLWFTVKAEPPIRYVVPQKLAARRIVKGRLCRLSPRPPFQLERTLRNVVMESVSGNERIWESPLRKLIANNRYPLRVEKFRWNSADPGSGVLIKIISSAP